MTRIGTISAMSILAVVSTAAISGACIAVAVTWLIWSQGWDHWYPEAPFLTMVTVYAVVSVLGSGKRDANLWGFAAAFFIGLVLMLVFGMTISEVVHCSFDRDECINL